MSMLTDMRIVPAGAERDRYLPLLYLADDSIAQVHSYYQSGDLYAVDNAADGPAAIVLAIAQRDGTVELKSVAVATPLQGQGLGTQLLNTTLAPSLSRDWQWPIASPWQREKWLGLNSNCLLRDDSRQHVAKVVLIRCSTT